MRASRKRPCRASTTSDTSTTSIADNFGGIDSLPTLRKLHELAVWLQNSTIYANYWDDGG
jgi:hypothetical protein